MMKLKLKKFYRQRGFTLIELVISIALILVVISSLMSVLFSTLKFSIKLNTRDELFQESYFVSNYLYNEITSSDYIIDNSNSNSLGFALVKLIGVDDGEKNSIYRYTYYSLKDKNLIRHSINTKNKLKNNNFNIKMGVNNIVGGVEDIKCTNERDKLTIEIFFNKNSIKNNEKIIIAKRCFGEFN